MTARFSLVPALVLTFVVVSGWTAHAQMIRQETAGITITGNVTTVNAAERSVTLRGANDEGGTFYVVDDTTLLSGDEKIDLAGVHPGDRVAVTANLHDDGRIVASYLEILAPAEPGVGAGKKPE